MGLCAIGTGSEWRTGNSQSKEVFVIPVMRSVTDPAPRTAVGPVRNGPEIEWRFRFPGVRVCACCGSGSDLLYMGDTVVSMPSLFVDAVGSVTGRVRVRIARVQVSSSCRHCPLRWG